MLKKIIYIIVAIVIVIASVILLRMNKEITEERVYQYDRSAPISVMVDTLRLRNANDTNSYTGAFEPYKESKISAEMQGKVNSISVDVGSRVKAGQTLIQLDNSLLKLQLQSVDVQIEGYEADVNRYSVLAKAEAIQGVQLEKSELALKAANVQRATLLEQINKTTIKAPFDGIVTAKFTEIGAFAAPGMPLLQIIDISRLKFTANLPEGSINIFSLGDTSEIKADAYPGLTLLGEVTMIGTKANMGNSFPVQLLVRNTPDMKIKVGMSGSAFASKSSEAKKIIIPTSAIVGSNLKPQVYTVVGGKAVLQDVIVSQRYANKAVISNGLKEGDLLVTSGFINLFENANVIIK